jgi:hypothetical protein
MSKPDVVAAESARRELFEQAGNTTDARRDELVAIINDHEGR